MASWEWCKACSYEIPKCLAISPASLSADFKDFVNIANKAKGPKALLKEEPKDFKPAIKGLSSPALISLTLAPDFWRASAIPAPSFLNFLYWFIPSLVIAIFLAASAASSKGPEKALSPGIDFTKFDRPVKDFTPKFLAIFSDISEIFVISFFRALASFIWNFILSAILALNSSSFLANFSFCWANNTSFLFKDSLSFKSLLESLAVPYSSLVRE